MAWRLVRRAVRCVSTADTFGKQPARRQFGQGVGRVEDAQGFQFPTQASIMSPTVVCS